MVTTKKKLRTKPKPESKNDASLETTSAGMNTNNGSIKKDYLKSRNICKVTFRLPRIAAPDAKTVCIVGEFNNWSIYANPMNKLKNGDFKLTLELEPGREYQFRYLVDGTTWENDWNADKYVKNPFGDSDNSVVIL